MNPNPANPPAAIPTGQNNGSATAHSAYTEGEQFAEMACRKGVQVFRDELNQPYFSVPVSAPQPHFEVWPLSFKHSKCLRLLRRLFQSLGHGRISNADLAECIDALETRLDEEGSEVVLANRIGRSSDSVFLDLCDSAWRKIRVSSEGWELTAAEGPQFRRHKHQCELPEPLRGGDIDELFELIPIKRDSDRLLVLSWLVSAICSCCDIPILVPVGSPGSCKTTLTAMLRRLIDPSKVALLGEAERDHLVQVMFHHAVPCFDNLGYFSRRDADFFCRAVTGAKFERRRLYSNMDEQLIGFRRPIILNGVHLPTLRSDFLDRCLVLRMERVPEFKTREAIEKAADQAMPRLLGALLDLTVETLRHLPDTPAPTRFRMSDFARLGRAVARARNRSDDEFDRVYGQNLSCQSNDSILDDPFAAAATQFVAHQNFEGTATEFLAKLVPFAKHENLEHGGRNWPAAPSKVTQRLDELSPLLQSVGLLFERLPRTNQARSFRLRKANTIQDEADSPSGDAEVVSKVATLAEIARIRGGR